GAALPGRGSRWEWRTCSGLQSAPTPAPARPPALPRLSCGPRDDATGSGPDHLDSPAPTAPATPGHADLPHRHGSHSSTTHLGADVRTSGTAPGLTFLQDAGHQPAIRTR